MDILDINQVRNQDFNLNLEPAQVRISKQEIDRRFQNIIIFNELA